MTTDSGRQERPETSPGGSPPRPPQPSAGYAGWQNAGAGPATSFFDSVRRIGIWRTRERWIGGVAGGVARRLDVDPLLIRGLLVVMTFFGGVGLLLYGLGWAMLPEESDGRIHTQEALRGNVDAALAGAAVFVLVGLVRPGFWWDEGYWFVDWFLPTIVLLGIVGLILALLIRRRDSRSPAATGPTAPGAAPPYAAAPAAGYQAAAEPSGPSSWSEPAPGAGEPTTAPTAPTATAPTAWPGTGTEATGAPGATPPGYGPVAAEAAGVPFGTAYGQAAYGSAPTAPTTPPTPPPPPRPVTPGPGRGTVGVVLGLCLLLLAALVTWDRLAPQLFAAGTSALVIGGAMLVVLGLGVAIAGLRGRRGRGLTALGVLLALLMLPLTAAATYAPDDFGDPWRGGSEAAFGDATFTPRSVDVAAEGYSMVAGNLVVDLTDLELGDAPATVPVSLGAGDLEIVLPDGAAVDVEVETGDGQLRVETGDGWAGPTGSVDGVFTRRGAFHGAFTSPEAQETGPELTVRVSVGAGDILIEEEQ